MEKKAACVLIRHRGYIEFPDRYLAVGRRDNPNAFGLPGGKIEPGETPLEAASRELTEETGYIIRNPKDPKEVFSAVDEEGWHTTTFLCDLSVVAPGTPSDVLNVKWVTKEDLSNGPFGNYNKKLFAKLGWS